MTNLRFLSLAFGALIISNHFGGGLLLFLGVYLSVCPALFEGVKP